MRLAERRDSYQEYVLAGYDVLLLPKRNYECRGPTTAQAGLMVTWGCVLSSIDSREEAPWCVIWEASIKVAITRLCS